MRLSDRTDNNRDNNLDLIRLIAAIMVIWCHAYPIILGKGAEQPLQKITDNQLSLGDLGVAIFFVISGFLVSQSLLRLNNLKQYTKARALRIFPGLILCVILSTFLLGPLFTSLPLSEYITNNQTYHHLIAITTLNFLSPLLPGVFEENAYGAQINGSLWTLKYELICYLSLALFWKLKLINKKNPLLILITLLILYTTTKNEHIENLAKLSLLFFSGTVFYLYRKEITLNYKLACIAAIALIAANQTSHLNLATPIFGTYLVLYFGYRWKSLFNCTKYGDISYGMYIYGWPAQQISAAINPNQSILENILISISIAIPLSYISWHAIEKPFINLKNKNIEKNTHRTPPPPLKEKPNQLKDPISMLKEE